MYFALLNFPYLFVHGGPGRSFRCYKNINSETVRDITLGISGDLHRVSDKFDAHLNNRQDSCPLMRGHRIFKFSPISCDVSIVSFCTPVIQLLGWGVFKFILERKIFLQYLLGF